MEPPHAGHAEEERDGRLGTAEREFRAIGLGTRMILALARNRVCTLADLGRLTERDLSGCRGIGRVGIEQVRSHLRPESAGTQGHGRPRVVPVLFPPATLTAIDGWAGCRDDIRSRAEAVRRLVELGLSVGGDSKS